MDSCCDQRGRQTIGRGQVCSVHMCRPVLSLDAMAVAVCFCFVWSMSMSSETILFAVSV
jgi:hypothetical protein